MNPWTDSEGQVAHHATKADDFPASVNMFQRAFTLRHRLETGTTCPVFGSFARKSMMPCSSGGLPVATLVHSKGDSQGIIVFIFPQAPRALRRSRLGSCPFAISGLMISQSAPSRPRMAILTLVSVIRSRSARDVIA